MDVENIDVPRGYTSSAVGGADGMEAVKTKRNNLKQTKQSTNEPFRFAQRSGLVDFRGLAKLDLNVVEKSGEPFGLQHILPSIVYSRVTSESVSSAREEDVVAWIRALQFAAEYGMHVQNAQAAVISAGEAEVLALRAQICQKDEEIALLKSALKSRKETLATVTMLAKRTAATVPGGSPQAVPPGTAEAAATLAAIEPNSSPKLVYRCTLCPKAFKNHEFLASHLSRRHPGAADGATATVHVHEAPKASTTAAAPPAAAADAPVPPELAAQLAARDAQIKELGESNRLLAAAVSAAQVAQAEAVEAALTYQSSGAASTATKTAQATASQAKELQDLKAELVALRSALQAQTAAETERLSARENRIASLTRDHAAQLETLQHAMRSMQAQLQQQQETATDALERSAVHGVHVPARLTNGSATNGSLALSASGLEGLGLVTAVGTAALGTAAGAVADASSVLEVSGAALAMDASEAFVTAVGVDGVASTSAAGAAATPGGAATGGIAAGTRRSVSADARRSVLNDSRAGELEDDDSDTSADLGGQTAGQGINTPGHTTPARGRGTVPHGTVNAALTAGARGTAASAVLASELQSAKRRIADLEKELLQKERSLAEQQQALTAQLRAAAAGLATPQSSAASGLASAVKTGLHGLSEPRLPPSLLNTPAGAAPAVSRTGPSAFNTPGSVGSNSSAAAYSNNGKAIVAEPLEDGVAGDGFRLSYAWQRLPVDASCWAGGSGYKSCADADVALPSGIPQAALWSSFLPSETQFSDSEPPRVRIPREWTLVLETPGEGTPARSALAAAVGVSSSRLPKEVRLTVSRSTTIGDITSAVVKRLAGAAGSRRSSVTGTASAGPLITLVQPTSDGQGAMDGIASSLNMLSLSPELSVEEIDLFHHRPVLQVQAAGITAATPATVKATAAGAATAPTDAFPVSSAAAVPAIAVPSAPAPISSAVAVTELTSPTAGAASPSPAGSMVAAAQEAKPSEAPVPQAEAGAAASGATDTAPAPAPAPASLPPSLQASRAPSPSGSVKAGPASAKPSPSAVGASAPASHRGSAQGGPDSRAGELEDDSDDGHDQDRAQELVQPTVEAAPAAEQPAVAQGPATPAPTAAVPVIPPLAQPGQIGGVIIPAVARPPVMPGYAQAQALPSTAAAEAVPAGAGTAPPSPSMSAAPSPAGSRKPSLAAVVVAAARRSISAPANPSARPGSALAAAAVPETAAAASTAPGAAAESVGSTGSPPPVMPKRAAPVARRGILPGSGGAVARRPSASPSPASVRRGSVLELAATMASATGLTEPSSASGRNSPSGIVSPSSLVTAGTIKATSAKPTASRGAAPSPQRKPRAGSVAFEAPASLDSTGHALARGQSPAASAVTAGSGHAHTTKPRASHGAVASPVRKARSGSVAYDGPSSTGSEPSPRKATSADSPRSPQHAVTAGSGKSHTAKPHASHGAVASPPREPRAGSAAAATAKAGAGRSASSPPTAGGASDGAAPSAPASATASTPAPAASGARRGSVLAATAAGFAPGTLPAAANAGEAEVAAAPAAPTRPTDVRRALEVTMASVFGSILRGSRPTLPAVLATVAASAGKDDGEGKGDGPSGAGTISVPPPRAGGPDDGGRTARPSIVVRDAAAVTTATAAATSVIGRTDLTSAGGAIVVSPPSEDSLDGVRGRAVSTTGARGAAAAVQDTSALDRSTVSTVGASSRADVSVIDRSMATVGTAADRSMAERVVDAADAYEAMAEAEALAARAGDMVDDNEDTYDEDDEFDHDLDVPMAAQHGHGGPAAAGGQGRLAATHAHETVTSSLEVSRDFNATGSSHGASGPDFNVTGGTTGSGVSSSVPSIVTEEEAFVSPVSTARSP